MNKINNNKISSPINSLKININYNELKKKEQKLLKIDLNSRVIKGNAHINKLKSELNKVMNEINNWNKILKTKNVQNLQYNKYINSMSKSKDDTHSKDEADSDLEEDNDMNFGYNME